MKDVTKRNKRARHAPLAKQLESDLTIKQRVRVGKLSKEKDDITEEEYVSNKLSKKILAEAREQVEEEHEHEEEEAEEEKGKKGKKPNFRSFEELMAMDDTSTIVSEFSETESKYNQDNLTVNEEDERALAMFMNPVAPKRLLSDIIAQKIEQFERNEKRKLEMKDFPPPPRQPDIKPEIVQVYQKVGEVLRYFTNGKLPKAFRVLPSLRNWEQLLYLTRPDRWSSVATRMATLLFSRGMSDKLVQRFYFIILLPKIREDILEHKKLNFHYYLALKKSLYRPASFFRGVLLPLCESGDCTLREATIVGSVMRRVSIPAVHASVAIYKLCHMPYYGATQHFILILLNKKFSLPYKVIDCVYAYFMKFMDDKRKFPTLWHQTLLVFAQRYKGDLTAEQKHGLQRLTHAHAHASITHEVMRELFSTRSRGDAPAEAARTAMEV